MCFVTAGGLFVCCVVAGDLCVLVFVCLLCDNWWVVCFFVCLSVV
jgi:hypothetical protein